ncbi:hypothetical protein [Pseudomonas putida]|uniref:hypothetical protein n=1 Tax=Pseudomonas putida TaxID=303 RepID=UPI000E1B63EC|nr:hypothetical protein [Pseudomonas putida]
MSEIKIFIEIVGGRLNVRHSIEKHDSEELSKFQAIGLLYHMLDYIAQLNPGLEHSALGVAREIFGGEGWADEVIELLLAAKTWESRMSVAWHAVDDGLGRPRFRWITNPSRTIGLAWIFISPSGALG